jgi:HTH-type transcriptional regulator / antitoxin HigA
MNSTSESFLPDWFSHPGETLNEALRSKDMNAHELAEQANWSLDSTLDLLYGWKKIDTSVALKLSTFLGASPDFWLRRQADFENDLNRCVSSICQRQSKSEPKGSTKCCHFGVSAIAA